MTCSVRVIKSPHNPKFLSQPFSQLKQWPQSYKILLIHTQALARVYMTEIHCVYLCMYFSLCVNVSVSSPMLSTKKEESV